jgi:hypothetical protein
MRLYLKHDEPLSNFVSNITLRRYDTDAAPGPNDVVWHNVALTTRQRFNKTMQARAIAALMAGGY